MSDSRYFIDGCVFTEGVFNGFAPRVRNSSLTAFFLTMPGVTQGYRGCTEEIGALYNFADDPANGVMIAKTIEDIHEAKKKGIKAAVIAFQDPQSIENSLDKLRVMYELGLRVMQMTYNMSNYIGSGCVETTDRGLTDFGRKALEKMNEWGIVADVSHCGPQTTLDVLRTSRKPIVISHACPDALTKNVRNKSDEMLKLLKENGGVIGLSSWGPLCWKNDHQKKRPTLSDFVDHIDYVVDLIGMDHVGFGSDSMPDDAQDQSGLQEQSTLYGKVVEEYNRHVGVNPDERNAIGITGPWDIENVYAEMAHRGYSEEDISKFSGGNLLRVLGASWKS